MSKKRQKLGKRGEEHAARWLVDAGWTVLARNWRCRIGELDLVVTRQVARGRGVAQLVAFVEVKTRRAGLAPKLSVTAAKRRRIVRLATWFLKDLGWRSVVGRFDVIEVVWAAGASEPKIVHHESVFDASGRARR
jgi:putative endonuclease